MSDLIVINGKRGSGRTTTSINLAHYLRAATGARIACCQPDKHCNDIPRYHLEGIPHYTLPLEIVKGIKTLEDWLPVGYDHYILEGKQPGAGILSDLITDLINPGDQNICIPFGEYRYTPEDREKPLPIVTQTPPDAIFGIDLTIPVIDQLGSIFGGELIRSVPVSPGLVLPRYSTRILATGWFPGEWFDICPLLEWQLNIDRFMAALEWCDMYDIILVGYIPWIQPEDAEKIRNFTEKPVLCYYPPIYRDCIPYEFEPIPDANQEEIVDILKNAPVGTLFPAEGDIKRYNNQYWSWMQYTDIPLIEQHGNALVFSGWVHPIYLIRDRLIPL